MNVEEKERLIKKDIAMIENKVRHAFNQGYEMGVKESRSEIPNTCGDAISRQAVLNAIRSDKYDYAALDRYVKDLPPVTSSHTDMEIQKIQEMEQAEIQKAYELGKAEMQPCDDAISRADARHLIAETNRNALGYISTKVFKILYDGIDKLPSVTPNQRIGRWIPTSGWGYKCSECEGMDSTDLGYFCKWCGAKMEVSGCTKNI